MGPEVATSALRRGFSMGASGGVLVTDPALRGADALATARVLAAAVGRTPFDLVLAGVESTDGYTGTLPMTVAELLGVPSATFARKVEVDDGALRVERQTEAGYDVVTSPMPALVTVTGSAAEPRYPTLKGIMAAKSKPLEQLVARRPRPDRGRRRAHATRDLGLRGAREGRRRRRSRPATTPPPGSPSSWPRPRRSDVTKVWVYAEVTPEGPSPSALELLTKARSIGDEVAAVALGPGATAAAPALGEHGAARGVRERRPGVRGHARPARRAHARTR